MNVRTATPVGKGLIGDSMKSDKWEIGIVGGTEKRQIEIVDYNPI